MSTTPRSRAEARRRSDPQAARARAAGAASWPRRILCTLLGAVPARRRRPRGRLRDDRRAQGQRGRDGADLGHLLLRRQDRDGPHLRVQPRVGGAQAGARSTCSGRCSPPRTATSTRTTASPRPASPAPCGSPSRAARRPRVGRRSPSSTSRTTSSARTGRCQRKAREILISVKIDGQQSKDEILENYLNTIYYGRGAYGIQTAAKAYFGKDVSKITPAEGAFLASAIRGPVVLRPAPRCGADQERADPLRLHPRRDGGAGLAHAAAARRRHLPEVRRALQAAVGRGAPTATSSSSSRTSSPGRSSSPRPTSPAAGCGSSRPSTSPSRRPRSSRDHASGCPRSPPGPQRRARLDQAGRRRGPGALRRGGLRQEPVQHRDRRHDAGRLGVQDLHPHRRPAGR